MGTRGGRGLPPGATALLILVVAVVVVAGVLQATGTVDIRKMRVPGFAIGGQPFVIGGATTQSVSCNIPFGSTTLTGVMCIVTVAVTGGSDTVVAGITRDELRNRVQQPGIQFQHDIEITFQAKPELAQYGILPEDIEVRGFGAPLIKEGWDAFAGQNPTNKIICPSKTEWAILAENYAWPGDDYVVWVCEQSWRVGQLGRIQHETTESTVVVTVKNVGSGASATATVSNRLPAAPLPEAGQGATVSFSGGLVTGDQAPDASRFAGFWGETEQRWRVITFGAGEDYRGALGNTKRALDSLRSKCNPGTVGTALFGGNKCEGGKSQIVADIESAIAPNDEQIRLLKNMDVQIRAGAVEKFDSLSGSKVTVELERRLTNPTVTLTLPAEWIGVLRAQGKPDVTMSGECTATAGGLGGNALVSVKNIGPGTGRFALSSQCSGAIGLSGFSNIIELAAGASKTVSVSVSAPVGAGASTCDFTATDMGGGGSDTATGTCKIVEPRECIIGATGNNGLDIIECQLVAGVPKWVTVKSCGADEIVISTATGRGCESVKGLVAEARTEGGRETAFTPAPGETERGEPITFACDIWCKLGRINPAVYIIVAVLAAGVVGGLYMIRRGYVPRGGSGLGGVRPSQVIRSVRHETSATIRQTRGAVRGVRRTFRRRRPPSGGGATGLRQLMVFSVLLIGLTVPGGAVALPDDAAAPPARVLEAPRELVPLLPAVAVNCTTPGVQRRALVGGGVSEWDIETCRNEFGRGPEWLVTHTCDTGNVVSSGPGQGLKCELEGPPRGPGGGHGPPPWAAAWDVVRAPFAGFWKWITGGR